MTTLRRHACFTLVALSLSCQAFVTSSRFGMPFVRGGSAAPLADLAPQEMEEQLSAGTRRRPLGVLRSPTNRRGRGPSAEADDGDDDSEKQGTEQEEAIGSRPPSTTADSPATAEASTTTPTKQVVQVSAKGLYRVNKKGRAATLPLPPDDTTTPNSNSNSDTAAVPCSNGAFASHSVEYVAETKLPTDIGAFQLRGYKIPGAPQGQEPCVIYCRDKPPFGTDGQLAQGVPVRIHDQCLTSEVFRSQRCDCKEQLNMALRYIQKHGGFIIYLQQEGRGIGLANKIAAYALQDVGLDTVDANLHLGFAEDCREYGVVKSILEDMKVASIQLMTNNPRKVDKLAKLGVTVDRTLPMVVPATNPYNFKYLETKEKRMNHANLATLLAQDPQAVQKQMTQQQEQLNNNKNGAGTGMAPLMDLPHLAAEYVNNGTEMSANAVQVSLMTDDDVETSSTDGTTKEEAGVTAHDDGYCFGRQSVEAAITAVGRGEMVVVVDDMDRENEGDFIMAADLCTDLDMARIVRYSSGVVCIALEQDRLDKLQLPPMVTNNQDPKGTAFTVSVDATKEHGITTGISASDRSTTVQLLAKADSVASDFHRPGHVFPLRAREGGVLTRDGHTEAAVDLAKLAGRAPAGVLCEIVSEENPTEMMRLPEIKRFCQRHGFVLTSIVDLQQYRRDTENMVDAEH